MHWGLPSLPSCVHSVAHFVFFFAFGRLRLRFRSSRHTFSRSFTSPLLLRFAPADASPALQWLCVLRPAFFALGAQLWHFRRYSDVPQLRSHIPSLTSWNPLRRSQAVASAHWRGRAPSLRTSTDCKFASYCRLS